MIINSLREIMQTRRCSYCREEGHNVTSCNHNDLIVFESMLHTLKQILQASEYEMTVSQMKQYLNVWLLVDIDRRLTRGFAMRKCGGLSRDSIQKCCDKIIYYIWPNSENDMIEIEASTTVDMLYQLLVDEDITQLQRNRLYVLITILEQAEQAGQTKFAIETEYKNLLSDTETRECGICYNELSTNKFVTINCSHSFCSDCIRRVFETSVKNEVNPKCAFCRVPVSKVIINDENIDFSNFIV
jgi:hypothetical protein